MLLKKGESIVFKVTSRCGNMRALPGDRAKVLGHAGAKHVIVAMPAGKKFRVRLHRIRLTGIR